MFHSYQLMFFMMILLSTIFQLSSSFWFSIWVGMELNLLAFIPFLSVSNNQLFNEGSMKYFLVQTFGSVILLMGWLMSSFLIWLSINFESSLNCMMYISLILKMGAAPFHFWFPSILENLNWFSSFLLMSWQKLSPLMMLSYVNQLMYFLCLSSMLSAIIGGVGGFNQISLRKLFAYSSIGHLGWLLICLILTELIFYFYYMFYFFMMMLFCSIFYINSLNSLSQFYCYNESFFMEKFIIMMSLLSLGGLPPLSGFFPKWLLLNELLMMEMKFLSTILLMSTLMALYYYMRIGYSFLMFSSMKIDLLFFYFTFQSKSMIKLIMLMMISNLILIPIGIWLF